MTEEKKTGNSRKTWEKICLWFIAIVFVGSIVAFVFGTKRIDAIESLEPRISVQQEKRDSVQAESEKLNEKELLEEKDDLITFLQKDYPSAKEVQSIEIVDDLVNLNVFMDNRAIQKVAFRYNELNENIPTIAERLKDKQKEADKTIQDIDSKINDLEKEKAKNEKELAIAKKLNIFGKLFRLMFDPLALD